MDGNEGCSASGKGGMEERKKKKYMSMIMRVCNLSSNTIVLL